MSLVVNFALILSTVISLNIGLYRTNFIPITVFNFINFVSVESTYQTLKNLSLSVKPVKATVLFFSIPYFRYIYIKTLWILVANTSPDYDPCRSNGSLPTFNISALVKLMSSVFTSSNVKHCFFKFVISCVLHSASSI